MLQRPKHKERGKCPGCNRIVPVRLDNGRLWAHLVHPLVRQKYGNPVNLRWSAKRVPRCRFSGQYPIYYRRPK